LLCFIKHYGIKPHTGVEVQLHTILTLALHGDVWSALCLGSFTFRKNSSST